MLRWSNPLRVTANQLRLWTLSRSNLLKVTAHQTGPRSNPLMVRVWRLRLRGLESLRS